MRLTNKQLAILTVVIAGNRDENGNFSFVDLDQLIERLEYKPTKAAIHFSIRKLIAKDLIVKAGLENRRDRKHVLIAPTHTAIEFFKSKENDSYLEPTE